MRGADELEQIVRGTPWLMEALDTAREVNPPDWLIGGGALRSVVWDRLHDAPEPTPIADVDLAFFDPADLTSEGEFEVEKALTERLASLPWEARNQAAVHTWYPEKFGLEVEPLTSSADGIGTWPETATAVALRLERDGALTIVAPFGLADLLGLVHQRNPRRVSDAEYRRRLISKRIAERWPKATIG